MPGDPAVTMGDALNLGDPALTLADLLNMVAIKLPQFWPYNIETWFVQTESQFCLKGVSSSENKFDYCFQFMSQEVAANILAISSRPSS